MKKISTLFLVFSLLSTTLISQSVLDRFGGLSTDFKITSDSSEMEIIWQSLVEKEIIKKNEEYVVVKEKLFLEFGTFEEIKKTRRDRRYLINRVVLLINCYDKQGRHLISREVPVANLRHTWSNAEPSYNIYTIRIDNIPLAVLDLTHTIDIKYVH